MVLPLVFLVPVACLDSRLLSAGGKVKHDV